MTTQFGELRKKATAKPKKPAEPTFALKRQDSYPDDELMMLKKNSFNPSSTMIDSPSLKLGRQLINKSMRLKLKESKKISYKKSSNLNLSDYLRLYSMSKKSQSKTKTERTKSEEKEQVQGLQGGRKLNNIIDTTTSIKVVRQETRKQINSVNAKLNDFLKSLDKEVKFDEESLVFMCNVLHIFEDRIVQTAKYAQQLIDERKKIKDKQELLNFKCNTPIRKMKSKEKSGTNSKVSTDHRDSPNFRTVRS